MKTIKYALILGLAALLAPGVKAQLVDFHFGAATQTGAAAIGNAGDWWNAANTTNGGPLMLKDTTGMPTTISMSWTSGDAWVATKPIYVPTVYAISVDAATAPLMGAYAASYAYWPARPTWP